MHGELNKPVVVGIYEPLVVFDIIYFSFLVEMEFRLLAYEIIVPFVSLK